MALNYTCRRCSSAIMSGCVAWRPIWIAVVHVPWCGRASKRESVRRYVVRGSATFSSMGSRLLRSTTGKSWNECARAYVERHRFNGSRDPGVGMFACHVRGRRIISVFLLNWIGCDTQRFWSCRDEERKGVVRLAWQQTRLGCQFSVSVP